MERLLQAMLTFAYGVIFFKRPIVGGSFALSNETGTVRGAVDFQSVQGYCVLHGLMPACAGYMGYKCGVVYRVELSIVTRIQQGLFPVNSVVSFVVLYPFSKNPGINTIALTAEAYTSDPEDRHWPCPF